MDIRAIGDLGAGFLGACVPARLAYWLILKFVKKDGANAKDAPVWAFLLSAAVLSLLWLESTHNPFQALFWGFCPALVVFVIKRRRANAKA